MTTWFVPGRIEVLGKHTDYAGGRVLVCAVDRGVTVRTLPGARGVEATSAHGDPVRLEAGRDPGLPAGHWGRYLQTVLDRLTRNFGPLPPTRLRVESDLPLASGMSSSSALLVGCALALAEAAGLPDKPPWTAEIRSRLDLAGYLACVENGSAFGGLVGDAGVGTRGGSEDHCAMLCGEQDRLSRFRFDPMAAEGTVAFPGDWAFVVASSGVRAEKTGAARDAYNAASAMVGEIVLRAGAALGSRERTLAGLVGAAGAEAVLGAVADSPALTRRLQHFLAESERLVPAGAEAVAAGDAAALGVVAAESHRLASELLGNQIPQTNHLVASARRLGAPAASAFGAGFGGSVWAVVPRADADGFARDWLEEYRQTFRTEGDAAETIVTRPSEAAHSVGP
ncbi:MAG: galactokinase [Propionibacterium sp.]|nr:galactokinase [Propionibacterium sp.]